MFERPILLWLLLCCCCLRLVGTCPRLLLLCTARLLLRLLLAVEFWAAGREKWLGDNWFADIQSSFPWPFSVIDPTVSWHMATWAELGGAVLLVLGLGTRFAAASLMVLTVVATWAVHWPAELNQWADLPLGYVITDEGHGNFKLQIGRAHV